MTGPDLLLSHLRRITVAAPLTGLADVELLRRFTTGGCHAEAAFEVLVRRHGPMVLRVCRTVLGDAHAADDAFQAAFLVLVKKSPNVPPRSSLGPWLFGVARRVCQHARATAARRARTEGCVVPALAADAGGLDPDVAATVHAEVGRLPEALRAAVVLCDLGGLSYQEAADRLGLPHATVRGRIARARERLRRRLQKRGIGPDILGGVAVTVPAALAGTTARAAMVINGMATGAVSAPVLELVTGGLTSMVWTQLKAAGFSTVTVGVLIAGAVGLGAQHPTPRPEAAEDEAAPRRTPLLQRYAAQSRPRTGDPAAAIAKLAAEAKDLHAAGDAKGARQALRQLHAAVFEWEDVLADGAATPRPSPAATQVPPASSTFAGRLVPAETRPATRSPADPDLEARMRRLEEKLDKLMKQLDSPRKADGPAK